MAGEAAEGDLRRSHLDAEHRALGARMVPFGGWEMPLQYDGVLEEHRRCREDAVAFDVSHLGSVRVTGAGTFEALQGLFTNDLSKITPGQAQYTHLLDPSDAHVVDDIIVWWLESEDFLVIPNAANTEPAFSAMREAATHGSVDDVTAQRAFIAVQGPRARERLKGVLPDAAGVERFDVVVTRYEGVELIAGGTGYTGEDGLELFVPSEVAVVLWRSLLDAGIAPAGLGARDTLRLEMGYPLHGHELGPGITPLQAGLGWVVAWEKGEFRGRNALEAERERGVERRLRGLTTGGRQIPRGGCRVVIDGRPVGEVVSGNFSPTLQHGIGLAFVPPDVEPGDRVDVEIRRRLVPAEVVKPPFIER